MTWANVSSLRRDTRETRVARHLQQRQIDDWPPELEAQFQNLMAHLGPACIAQSHQALADHYAARDTARQTAHKTAA